MKHWPKYRRITALRALERLEELREAKQDVANSFRVSIPQNLFSAVCRDYREHVQSYLSKGKRR